jgi:hypothetical protein
MSNKLAGVPVPPSSPSISVTPKPAPTMTDKDIAQIRNIVDAFYGSAIANQVCQLNDVIEGSYQLSDWEIKVMDELFEKYFAKYKSPLAEAMK